VTRLGLERVGAQRGAGSDQLRALDAELPKLTHD